ncbi:hypothetical protein GOP47_0011817 [Adiantum capillus-veneris]|uniref:Uncharacterized protein n=1 Tax=Adiantum capillus-veneris TaxID=13818 RepID=A0A9D4UTH0_ADICA|nr:hypothetical protein GOP47_0011817 [Adiantum capillus-veneris]
MYEVKTPGRILALEKTLMDLQVSSFPTIQKFISRMLLLCDELAACGHQISSEGMATWLLLKLPDTYDSLFQSLTTSTRPTPITWEELLPTVQKIASLIQDRATSDALASASALVSTSGGSARTVWFWLYTSP